MVLDTNVLVSGFLAPGGPPGRTLDLVLRGDLELAVDDRIRAEYDDVLRRPALALPTEEVAILPGFLAERAARVSARPLALGLPDVDDEMFVEVAREAGADALVTGNLRHYPRVAEAISPRRFLDRFTKENAGRQPPARRRGVASGPRLPAATRPSSRGPASAESSQL